VRDARLMGAITSSIVAAVDTLGPQNVANAVWALATLRHRQSPVLEVMAARAAAGVADFISQELANSVWAFAKLHFRSDPLMAAFCAEAMRRMQDESSDFDAMCLASISWAFATLGYWDEELLDATGQRLEKCLASCKTQELSNLAWGFATLAARQHMATLSAIAGAAVQRIHEFEQQHITNTAWSLARLAVVYLPFMEAASGIVREKAHQFDVQGLSNSVWCFAKVLHHGEPACEAIARAAVARAAELTSQEMGNTSWAFARLSVYNEQLAACRKDGRRMAGESCPPVFGSAPDMQPYHGVGSGPMTSSGYALGTAPVAPAAHYVYQGKKYTNLQDLQAAMQQAPPSQSAGAWTEVLKDKAALERKVSEVFRQYAGADRKLDIQESSKVWRSPWGRSSRWTPRPLVTSEPCFIASTSQGMGTWTRRRPSR
ncbi:unnamed protein product, partial [Effrenium voratum]